MEELSRDEAAPASHVRVVRRTAGPDVAGPCLRIHSRKLAAAGSRVNWTGPSARAGPIPIPSTLRAVKRLADGIWQLESALPISINAYLVDDVLFDCRTRWSAGRILRQVRERPPSVLALTHAHPDHWGAAGTISDALGIPVVCHHADAAVVRGERCAGSGWHFRLGRAFLEGRPCPAVVGVEEGDRVGEFEVVHAPGHSDGHVVYFRERDGVAVVGDVVNTGSGWGRGPARPGTPPAHLSVDVEENRRSISRLRSLRPRLLLPGHGPAVAGARAVDDLLAAVA